MRGCPWEIKYLTTLRRSVSTTFITVHISADVVLYFSATSRRLTDIQAVGTIEHKYISRVFLKARTQTKYLSFHISGYGPACYLLYSGFLLGLFFKSEDVGGMFLWNISWLATDYVVFLYLQKKESAGLPVKLGQPVWYIHGCSDQRNHRMKWKKSEILPFFVRGLNLFPQSVKGSCYTFMA
jgi:hypothetical protein